MDSLWHLVIATLNVLSVKKFILCFAIILEK